MVTVYDLLIKEKKLIERANELRYKLVDQKRMRDLDEANAWVLTDFKELGATTDKLRGAVVKQKMNTMPNIYAQEQAKLINLETEISLIQSMIDVMKTFGVEECEFDEEGRDGESEDKDKESSS